jgi:DNA-binding NtrC family response regulator
MGIESKPQVLVVDDAQMVADTLTQILNLNGFLAVAAYNGEQALQLAGLQHFDHLVSDVVMDGMNGIEAAIAIRSLLPKCTVLLMSGNNDTSQLLREAEVRGHSFDILAKPFHPLAVMDQLRNSTEPAANMTSSTA